MSAVILVLVTTFIGYLCGSAVAGLLVGLGLTGALIWAGTSSRY